MLHSVQTIERLKAALNSNQASRERMCAQLLALMDGYSDIRPRRPQGGPDGGRDIEAIYSGVHKIFGAVGFKNDADDSAESKSWMRKKFNADLSSALDARPRLYGFVFFTNIDVTPAEEAELKQLGTSRGLSLVEVIGRENMRHYLDSPSGLSTRYQFLGITMSDEEQKAFFQIYGAKLENLILNRFGYIESRLERIEFLQEAANPIDKIGMVFIFPRPVEAKELVNAAVRVNIDLDRRPWSDELQLSDARALWLGAKVRTDVNRAHFAALDGWLWTTARDGSDLREVRAIPPSWRDEPEIESFDLFIYNVRGVLPFDTIAALDKRRVSIEITATLLGRIGQIWLVVNGYIVCKVEAPYDPNITDAERARLASLQEPHLGAIPALRGAAAGDMWPRRDVPDGWVTLAGEGDWLLPTVDFERYSPERLEKYVRIEQVEADGQIQS